MNAFDEVANLSPGDHFIQRVEYQGQSFFFYCIVKKIDEEGQQHLAVQGRQFPPQGVEIEKDSNHFAGKISKRAYKLACLRGWPNDEAGVNAILAYSSDESGALSLLESLHLMIFK